MKKIMVITLMIMILLFAFSVGCGEDKKKLVKSRPIPADDTAYVTEETEAEPAAPQPEQEPAPETQPEPETEETEEPQESAPAGDADCDKLSGSEVGAAMGGAWIKTDDCPKYPQMPEGVTVCQCSYQWKTNFVDVETQVYSDGSEDRVFDMYCSTSTTQVGDKSCTYTTPTGVQNVYFLKGDTFVKVVCRGGMCEMDKLEDLAETVSRTV